jgi:hypothetical protein
MDQLKRAMEAAGIRASSAAVEKQVPDRLHKAAEGSLYYLLLWVMAGDRAMVDDDRERLRRLTSKLVAEAISLARDVVR